MQLDNKMHFTDKNKWVKRGWLPLRSFCAWNTKKLLQTGRVASWLQGFLEQNFVVTYTSEWGGTQNEVWEKERWLNQVTNPVYPKIWKTMTWSLYHCSKKFWCTANQRGGRSFTWVKFKVFVRHYIRPSTSTNNLWQYLAVAWRITLSKNKRKLTIWK